MSTLTGLGRELADLRLNLAAGGAWSDTARRTTAWTEPPTIEFPRTGDQWDAEIDPADGTVAVFTEPRTSIAVRADGEPWRLRDTATDEILAKGRVNLQVTA